MLVSANYNIYIIPEWIVILYLAIMVWSFIKSLDEVETFIYWLLLILIMADVKCKKCGYSWKTKSKLLKVSCPSCGAKVDVKEQKK